jgi:hypothetical protein
MQGFKSFFEYGFADMAFYQGHGDVRDALEILGISTSSYDKIVDAGAAYASKFLKTIEKIDKIIGIKKTILLNVPTYKAKINFLTNVYKLSRHPKKIKSWVDLLSSLEEFSKLGLMNPLIAVPTAISAAHFAGVSDQDALVAAFTKITSAAYFYLDSMVSVFKNSQNIKIKEVAEKIAKLLPKSEIKR